MRIYPAVDIRDGRCVRLRQGDYSRETIFSDDPVAVARRWVELGADRLHIVDLDGARAGKPFNGPVIRRMIEAAGVPCQLGGGIRNDEHLEMVFDWGVRWAVLGTRALENPGWAGECAERFPSRIVLGIDARNGLVATAGWLATSQVRAIDLAQEIATAPFAAIVYTDIAKDGMMDGPNFAALAEMQRAVPLPIIASGGICTLEQIRQLLESQIPGCIVGRALYESQLDLPAVLALSQSGLIDARLT